MAAKPKLTPEQWADIRTRWESDSRDGYAWIVEEMGLPVSAPGVRKAAVKDGWTKATQPISIAPKGKVSKVSEGGNRNHAKVSQAIRETMAETIPETMVAANVRQIVKIDTEIRSVLTPKEERFVSEYLVDLNATQAYLRANPHVKEVTARTEGSRLLVNPNITAAVDKAKAERAARTGINADRALAEVWSIVTADTRELVQVKVGCCRNCYGEGHQSQRTVGEMNRDREKHTSKGKDIADFDEEGGIGFNPLRPPYETCPECGGDGLARVVLADTRNLSPQAAALYAGAKQGKNGIEIQMHSKADALDKVFKHLGLYEKEQEVNINVFPPREVLDAVYADSMRRSTERAKILEGRRERLGIVIENGESFDS